MVTIKDIANKVNMSTTTVSLVLNNKPCRVSEKNKKEIIECAKEMNYVPNNIARSLVLKKSRTLALIVPEIAGNFFSNLVISFEKYCAEENYFLMICVSNNQKNKDIEIIKNLVSRGVDGVFIALSDETSDEPEKIKLELERLTIPYVLVLRSLTNLKANQVYFDNVQGGYIATETLIKAGHKNIGCVKYYHDKNTNANARYYGYLKALHDYNIDFDENLVFDSDFSFIEGYNLADKIINTKATGLFCISDTIGYGIRERIRDVNSRTLSIVGYDNLPIHNNAMFKLSSINQDMDLLAYESTKILFDEINSKNKKNIVKILKCEYCSHNSVFDYETNKFI